MLTRNPLFRGIYLHVKIAGEKITILYRNYYVSHTYNKLFNND